MNTSKSLVNKRTDRHQGGQIVNLLRVSPFSNERSVLKSKSPAWNKVLALRRSEYESRQQGLGSWFIPGFPLLKCAIMWLGINLWDQSRDSHQKRICMIDCELVGKVTIMVILHWQGWTCDVSESFNLLSGFPPTLVTKWRSQLFYMCVILESSSKKIINNVNLMIDKIGHEMCLKASTCFPGFPQLLSQKDAHLL